MLKCLDLGNFNKHTQSFLFSPFFKAVRERSHTVTSKTSQAWPRQMMQPEIYKALEFDIWLSPPCVFAINTLIIATALSFFHPLTLVCNLTSGLLPFRCESVWKVWEDTGWGGCTPLPEWERGVGKRERSHQECTRVAAKGKTRSQRENEGGNRWRNNLRLYLNKSQQYMSNYFMWFCVAYRFIV